ncbi:hypothetical protein GCM10009854_13060 [Saccharopolyspora halophila]|uniref:Uncharacterized protein n=2 Tax=Saccharopolyspora halophila TaxID=405551 RepID=A0ABN3FUY7_9PSEU
MPARRESVDLARYGPRSPAAGEVDYRGVFQASSSPAMVLDTNLIIRDANPAYLRATGRGLADLVGRHIFDAFPDNPDDPDANGTANLNASLQAVLATRAAQSMGVQKYDVPDSGSFVEKYWSPVNSPIFAEDGELVGILHRVEDVTEFRDDLIRALRYSSTHGRVDPSTDVEVNRRFTEYAAAAMANTRLYGELASKLGWASQRFADLFDLVPVGIGVLDETDHLVDANSSLCELLGTTRADLVGTAGRELLSGDDPGTIIPGADARPEEHARERMLQGADGLFVHCKIHCAVSQHDRGDRAWLAVFQDITEQQRRAEELHYQATHDNLTGLVNRQGITEFLDEVCRNPGLAVLLCDVDNFKRINDSLGHAAGDELLVALARRLRRSLPAGVLPARLSGDEFLVIYPEVERHGDLRACADVVRDLLSTVVPVRGQRLGVSAAVGAAVVTEEASSEDLLRFADAALFEAKRRGPGQVAIAEPAMTTSVTERLYLEEELRTALERNELALHYQPIVDRNGDVIMAEALLRWPHPERGLLMPNIVLPVAEQGGLLPALDRWVLRTALTEAASWHTPQHPAVGITVNLLGLRPGDPSFVEQVADIVEASGIDWDRVVLELSEASFVDRDNQTRHAFSAINARGARFAVDDFGTGYSSLARLKDLPAQIIKLDRQFTADVHTDPADRSIAGAVADMARAMHRDCIAEGVETSEQLAQLDAVGLQAFQGWLFAPAIPPEQFRALLTEGRCQRVGSAATAQVRP